MTASPLQAFVRKHVGDDFESMARFTTVFVLAQWDCDAEQGVTLNRLFNSHKHLNRALESIHKAKDRAQHQSSKSIVEDVSKEVVGYLELVECLPKLRSRIGNDDFPHLAALLKRYSTDKKKYGELEQWLERHSAEIDATIKAAKWRTDRNTSVLAAFLTSKRLGLDSKQTEELVSCLGAELVSRKLDRQKRDSHFLFFSLHEVGELVFGDSVEPAVRNYWLRRTIRRMYGINSEVDALETFRTFAHSLEDIIPHKNHRSRTVLYEDLSTRLRKAGRVRRSDGLTPESHGFIATCLLCKYITTHSRQGRFRFVPVEIDLEYMISNLFGLPTMIPGFDDLFGGGGINFCDTPAFYTTHETNIPRGRVVLVRGGYGTGKSLLSLQLAAEVAAKGGTAWYFGLELTARDVRYMLESMSPDSIDRRFRLEASRVAAYQTRENDPNEVVSSPKSLGVLCALTHQVQDSDDTDTEEKASGNGAKKDTANAPMPLETVLDALKAVSENMVPDGPRAIFIDPVNALLLDDQAESDPERSKPRRLMYAALRKACDTGANVVLVAEEDDERWLGFGEDIADTVIRLGYQKAGDYTKRSLAVTKSRFQREIRGQQFFAIRSGEGIRISLTAAAIDSIDSVRVVRSLPSDGSSDGYFGLPSLDRHLGEKSVRQGDLILVSGPIGTFKTHLGLAFASWLNQQDFCDPAVRRTTQQSKKLLPSGSRSDNLNRKGLVVSMRFEQSEIDHRLASKSVKRAIRNNLLYRAQELAPDENTFLSRGNIYLQKQIDTLKLKPGFGSAGELFKHLEDVWEQARDDGTIIDRVLLDAPTEWSHLSPLLDLEPDFGPSLIRWFRRRQVAILATDRKVEDLQSSSICRAIHEAADMLLEIEPKELLGRRRMLLRVTKTPRMSHRWESVELIPESESGLATQPLERMLATDLSGRVQEEPVRLVVPLESYRMDDYLNNQKEVLTSTLAPEVTVRSLDRDAAFFAFEASHDSALPGLPIVALDSFQVSEIRKAGRTRIKQPATLEQDWKRTPESTLSKRLPQSAFGGAIQSLPKRISRQVWLNSSKEFTAVPFYDNISFLCYRDDGSGTLKKIYSDPNPWEAMAREADKVNPSIRFDCPFGVVENINSLFLEIFAYQMGDDFFKHDARGDHYAWSIPDMNKKGNHHEVAIASGTVFCRLLRKSFESRRYSKLLAAGSPDPEAFQVDRTATVWRQWFSTAQDLSDKLANDLSQDLENVNLKARNLPGRITTAGQWYLAIPPNVAQGTAEVGCKILNYLTSPNAEISRFRRGIGIPVCRLPSSEGKLEFDVPLSNLTIDELDTREAKVIERSKIKNYIKYSPQLADTLLRLLLKSKDIKPSKLADVTRREFIKLFEQVKDTNR